MSVVLRPDGKAVLLEYPTMAFQYLLRTLRPLVRNRIMKLTNEQRELMRQIGRKGGQAAASKMTAKARKLRAQRAARKRWKAKK